jgi:hypothetical protein
MGDDTKVYPTTPEELHEWAQAKRAENSLTGVRSEDLVNEWNEQRKNS